MSTLRKKDKIGRSIEECSNHTVEGQMMKCKYGMPTLLEFESLKENIQLCNILGLDFIEINLNFPYCDYLINDPAELSELLRTNNLFATIHMPEEINLASFNKRIRETHLSVFEDVCKWGVEFGCNKITFHLNEGIIVTLPHGKVALNNQYESLVISHLRDSFELLSELQSKYGVSFCLENTTFSDMSEQVFEIAADYGIGNTFDIGHDAKNGFGAGIYYKDNQEMVRHIHLHDYDGKSDHLELFKGGLDIKSVIEYAEEKSLSVVIEVKSRDELESSVKALHKRGLR